MLDLSANEIQAVPPLSAALPALAELILDENAIRALGDEISGLPKLKKLSARSNRIAAVDPFSGQQARKKRKGEDVLLVRFSTALLYRTALYITVLYSTELYNTVLFLTLGLVCGSELRQYRC